MVANDLGGFLLNFVCLFVCLFYHEKIVTKLLILLLATHKENSVLFDYHTLKKKKYRRQFCLFVLHASGSIQ